MHVLKKCVQTMIIFRVSDLRGQAGLLFIVCNFKPLSTTQKDIPLKGEQPLLLSPLDHGKEQQHLLQVWCTSSRV